MAKVRSDILSNPVLRINGILKNVYLWMAAGLALTGLSAYFVGTTPAIYKAIYSSGFGIFFLIILEFGLVFYISAKMNTISTGKAVGAFLIYSVVNGVMLSYIFLIYTGAVIAQAFFTAAGMFAGMSIYGAVTKRNLNRLGTYLIMGLWGLIIASVISMFFATDTMFFIISIVGVIIFLGLTAWDTQKIVRLADNYGSQMDEDTYVKVSILGALMLYLDFINIFLYLLRIFGRGSRD
ncbi:MAG: Bax inhibitor-1/YccA family protein [Sphaerochaetaceae bacterium]|nr:Bax inhibitor-1/YccA family protein [Sphaerochaetaceae bacterium]